jgi:hypothetical protein
MSSSASHQQMRGVRRNWLACPFVGTSTPRNAKTECGPVAYQEELCQQGTLALMVLKTLDVLGTLVADKE